MKSRALRQKLGELTTQLRQILKKAEDESRVKLNADEEQTYSRIETDIADLEAQISRVERQEAREADLARTANPHDAGRENRDAGPGNEPAQPALPEALRAQFRNDFANLEPEVRQRVLARCAPAYAAAFGRYLTRGLSAFSDQERRALQADAFVTGGATVAPMQFVAELLKAVDDQLFIRGAATVRQVVNAASLGIASLDADPDDADWTSELKTGNEDSAMAFGRRELTPHPLAKRIKVSEKLMRVSALGVEPLVRERLAYKFALAQEKSFLTGNGAGQPLGLFTASADGIPTSRDVNTGSATDITADGLIDSLYGLKVQYQRNATFVVSRELVKRVRKLKDSTNQYLWQPGLQGGQPSTILDRPFFMSEFCPSTFTTGLYVGLVGDLKFYWIADALDLQVKRLDELYSETNQVGFIGRMESDAMPVMAEAFSRLKTN